MKTTAKQFIIDTYGKTWLNAEWMPGDVMDAMDDFHELRSKEDASQSQPTDEDIEKWAENQWVVQTLFNYKGDGADLISMGAKALRDGKINH